MITPATPDPNAAQALFVKMGECTGRVSSSGGGAVPLALTHPEDCAAVKISPDGKQVAYFGETEKSTILMGFSRGIILHGLSIANRWPSFLT